MGTHDNDGARPAAGAPNPDQHDRRNGHDGQDGQGALDRRTVLLALLNHTGLDGSDGPGLNDGGSGGWGGAVPHGLPGLRRRLERVCVVTAARVGVDGAGVTVMASPEAGREGARDQVAAVGALTRRLEDLQLTAGEGPCLDAFASGAPVLAGDLAAETTRWLGFGPEALAVGVAAVFSLPLQVGAVRLGTLDLHRATAGPLTGEQLADALMLASLATETLLELAEHPDPTTSPNTTPHADAQAEGQAEGQQELEGGWLPDVHADVHMASGMVAAGSGIDVGAALLRIRGHAFASGEAISDVARRIIDRDLVLEPAPDHPETDGTDGTDGTDESATRHDGPPGPTPDPEND